MTAGPRPGGSEVVFVGRANVDLTVRVPYRGGPSQTVFGSPLAATAGGKSLNQAVAVARFGGRASLVAGAGDDHWGRLLEAVLKDSGVDATHLRLLPGVTTGAAIIEVTPDGENYLVLALSPGTELTAGQVADALSATAAPVVTVQLDMPPEPVAAALATPPTGTVRVGNLVPHRDLDPGLLHRLDVAVVNEHEAAAFLGAADVEPLAAVRQLRQLGPAAAVVTAGGRGAAYSHADRERWIAAGAVQVVDTTGAGDAFTGRLALDLSRHVPLDDAVAHAVQAGTVAVQHKGAHLPPGPPGDASADGAPAAAPGPPGRPAGQRPTQDRPDPGAG